MQLVKKFSTQAIMLQVIIATVPMIITAFVLFGTTIIWQISLAVATAIVIDIIAAKLQHKSWNYFITDYSSILTAILLALSIPTIADFWIIIIGVSFALIFAKYLYGGLGNNIFNPAMVGYAFLLISYPVEMTNWQVPATIFNTFDVISGATLLDISKNNLSPAEHPNTIFWLAVSALVGGVYLLLRKIIAWHIPVFVLVSFVFTLSIINLISGENHQIMLHLFAGSILFAAFFIATDPVSTCATTRGRIIFAIFVGFLIAIIRVFGNYPDGVAFAILLGNMIVPLIDYYTKS
jgi:electron transport complex protein RnfD